MKLSDLRSCDWCSKQIAGRLPDGRLSIQFYVVTLATAILNTRALNTNMGLLQMMGGSLQLAEVFSPEPDVALIVEDQPGAGGRDQALLCFDCWVGMSDPAVHLASLAERIAERKAEVMTQTATSNAETKATEKETPAPARGRAVRRAPKQIPAAPATPEE